MKRTMPLLLAIAASFLSLFLGCSTSPNSGNSITTDPTLDIKLPMQVLKGQAASFEVGLSTTNSVDVTFHYETADGTAKADTHYVRTAGNATIPRGSSKVTITVPTIASAINAHGKSFQLVISSPKNAKLGFATRGCLIYENVELIARDTIAVNGDTASIVIELNIIHRDSDVVFNYATVDSSAVAGTDYDAVSGVDTIAKGSLRATIRIPTRETLQAGKAFKLVISAADGAAIVRSSASCRLTEIPTITVTDASAVPAGDTAQFTISLNKHRATAIVFHYTTADSIAHSGVDYEATAGVDTIPPGSTGTVIYVPTRLDAQPGTNSVFNLVISGVERASVVRPSGLCRIAPLPNLSVADTAIVQGAYALFVVSLDEPPLAAVTFRYTTADSSALSDIDYFPADNDAQIAAGALSVVLPILTKVDAPYAANKVFKLLISAPTHARINRAAAVCRIDQAGATASFLNDVRPILLTANCARNGCHGGGSSSGGLNLGSLTYNGVRFANGTNSSFVVPNSAETSRLYRILTERRISPNSIRMPKDEPALSASDQQKIRNWIDQGAKDN